MRSTAPRRARTLTIVSTVAALLAGAALAPAQQPPAGAAAGAAPAASGTAKKAAGDAAAAKAAPTADTAASYSLGVIMGAQLRANGVTPAELSTTRLLEGLREGMSGKAKLTEADRANINKLFTRANEEAADGNHRAAAKFLAANAKKPDVVTTASGLQYKVINAGSGDAPKPGDEVTVNYRGTLLDGTEFDSSYKRGQPATFQVNRVIPGWTEALQLMKPGAKYQLFIPPQLAYDLRSPPPIPAGSMLLFDVELLSVKAAAPPPPAPPAPAPAPPK
jgi:FKBP-type peptidyl-prolyl cis-trans isomerase FkpA